MGAHSRIEVGDPDWHFSVPARKVFYDSQRAVGNTNWYALGEAQEREFCTETGKPWRRLTDAEQERAGQLAWEARKAGHRRLLWSVPRQPWPMGAVWPDRELWGIPVAYPYDFGPVALTARHWGRRYVAGVLREVDA